MKKQERKTLKQSLILAIKKQLLDNNAEVSGKFEKTVRKSIKQIVKKARKRKTIATPKVIVAPKVTKPTKKIKKSTVA